MSASGSAPAGNKPAKQPKANKSDHKGQTERFYSASAHHSGAESDNNSATTDKLTSKLASVDINASKPMVPVVLENEQPVKSKADMRRERKEIQEAQRAAKASGKPLPKAPSSQGNKAATAGKVTSSEGASKLSTVASGSPVKAIKVLDNSSAKDNVSTSQSNVDDAYKASKELIMITAPSILKLRKKASLVPTNDSGEQGSYKLFRHFDQYKRDYSITENFLMDKPQVHPAFMRLGIQMAHEKIMNSNSRCLAFLKSLMEFMHDYKSNLWSKSGKKTIAEEIESKLKPNINFITSCRPLSISMGNSIKDIKLIISRITSDTTESQAKELVIEAIQTFIDEKISLANDMICKYMLANNDIVISGSSYVKSKITNTDCIMVYSNSVLVNSVVIQAAKEFPGMRVIVVDSRPSLRGKKTLEKLVKHNIKCTYVNINAIAAVMNKVTKVMLGAQALLANGYVMSTIGSSQIALVAKFFNVPVVVCCETYKFCEKVQTDALINNELGDPNALLSYSSRTLNKKSPLAWMCTDNPEPKKSAANNITLLNLCYDITLPEFISCVVTDMGMLPCTSVPVVLRLKNLESTKRIPMPAFGDISPAISSNK